MSLPFASAQTIRVYTVGIDGDGRPSETGPTTTTPMGVVTPIDERALRALPEGLRSGARYRLRTEASLGDLGDEGGTTSTRLVVDGREYLLMTWGRWNQTTFGSLKHNKYLAREIQ